MERGVEARSKKRKLSDQTEGEDVEEAGGSSKKEKSSSERLSTGKTWMKPSCILMLKRKDLKERISTTQNEIQMLRSYHSLPDDEQEARDKLLENIHQAQKEVSDRCKIEKNFKMPEDKALFLENVKAINSFQADIAKYTNVIQTLPKLLMELKAAEAELKSLPIPSPSDLKEAAVFKEFFMENVDYYSLRATLESPPRVLRVPPTLVCKAFQTFINHLESCDRPPSAPFIDLANKLAAELSFCHTEAEERITHRVSLLFSRMGTKVWGGCIVAKIPFIRENQTKGMCHTDFSFCLNGSATIDNCIATVEFKKDTTEACRENIGYFTNMNCNKMFLICLYDCHCDILGAIRIKNEDGTKHFVVSPLAESVNFFIHPIDNIRCDKVLLTFAKHLEALSIGMGELATEFYQSEMAIVQDLFGMLPAVRLQCGNEIVFKKRLGPLVYQGIASLNDVVVKFGTQRYGHKVHNILHQCGYAPELLTTQTVGPLWSAYVMTYVQGKTLFEHLQEENTRLNEDIQSICEQLKNIQGRLQWNNVVHGDLRSNNIIVASNNKVFVIDFSWGGDVGTSRYPYSINKHIAWHPEVVPGGPIEHAHDAYMINHLICELQKKHEGTSKV